MGEGLPALNLVAVPGRRSATLELAREIERRGFAGISISSQYSNMAQSVALALATERIRTCICDDEDEAKSVLRRVITNYALMPNYRNYWKEAGYVEEMTAIEKAVADGRPGDIARYLHDRWLTDIALFGSAAKVRDGIEAWRPAGITTPVLVPLSADGSQKTAIEQVFVAFD